ncbi:MAG: ribonuclease HII, partial [Oscillospiraceae bacterium]|nr:ribonuclease HII [Oscillospiraceae bacterium]
MVKEELYSYDDGLRTELGVFCGVDEAGRGPLAGPVCCAAVVLRPESRFEWLDDSKKVTALRREALFDEITKEAAAYHIELIDNETIDEINILAATMLGMKKCIEALGCAAAAIDGNRVPQTEARCVSVIKGDAHSASIAAASILAKVTRDRFMDELAERYPQYGFEKHKGYPTKAHYEAIRKHGI